MTLTYEKMLGCVRWIIQYCDKCYGSGSTQIKALEGICDLNEKCNSCNGKGKWVKDVIGMSGTESLK